MTPQLREDRSAKDAGHVILIWWTKDGRKLPFNHPDARAERLEAMKDWKPVIYAEFEGG